jgi:hypothetical protein
MILIVTNREDVTADFVVLELKDRKKRFIRFNTEDFPEKTKIKVFYKRGRMHGSFRFVDSKSTLDFSSLRSIWYRRPVMPEFSGISRKYKKFCIRESLTVLNGVWDTLNCFWVSNPRNISLAENKLVQLNLASEIGLLVPKTIISNDSDFIREFHAKCKGNTIIKPVKVGILDDDSVIFTSKVSDADIKHLKSSRPLPSIYQENIKKKCDIRITVIGQKVFATEIHSQKNIDSQIDWRRSQDINLPHYRHVLPEDVKNKCFALVKRLGLKFGAIDMILSTKDKYYFLEINPNGQWAWIEKRTGYRLTEALVNMLVKMEK